VEQTSVPREAGWAAKREVVRADAAGDLDLKWSIDAWSLVKHQRYEPFQMR